MAFDELSKLLPEHDASVTMTKIEILKRAAEYIKQLQAQNEEIIKLGSDSVLSKFLDRSVFLNILFGGYLLSLDKLFHCLEPMTNNSVISWFILRSLMSQYLETTIYEEMFRLSRPFVMSRAITALSMTLL